MYWILSQGQDTYERLQGPSRWKKPKENNEERQQLKCTDPGSHTEQSRNPAEKWGLEEAAQCRAG